MRKDIQSAVQAFNEALRYGSVSISFRPDRFDFDYPSDEDA